MSAETPTTIQTDIHTDGGAAVTGTVTTNGGNFIGRDFIQHIHQTGAREALYVNVPPLPCYLYGRESLVDQLVARLCNTESTALSAQGLPGVGKTTLAVALAHHRTWGHRAMSPQSRRSGAMRWALNCVTSSTLTPVANGSTT